MPFNIKFTYSGFEPKLNIINKKSNSIIRFLLL
jgi:hypothetical protein